MCAMRPSVYPLDITRSLSDSGKGREIAMHRPPFIFLVSGQSRHISDFEKAWTAQERKQERC
jgi:hypothetical protein